jgi:O-antigen/teichoic acid export membrane protein
VPRPGSPSVGRAPVRAASLASAAVLSTVGVLVSGLARFLYSLLVGRVDGSAVLGQVNANISLATLACMLWPAATGAAASKFLARSGGAGAVDAAAAASAHLLRRTAASAAVLAVAAALAARLVLHASAATAAAVGVLTLAYSAYLLCRGVQFGRLRFGVAAVGEALAAGLSAGLLVGVLVMGWGTALLLPLAAGYALYAAVGWPRGARGRATHEQRREMDAFVAWGVVGNVASAGLLQLSVVVAAASDTPHRTGLYAAAVSLATPASMLSRSLTQVLFPSMARAAGGGDAEGVRLQTDVVTRGLVTVMVAVFGVLLLLAEPLLHVYGASFVPAAGLLQLTLVAVLLSTVSVAAVSALTSGPAWGIRASAGMSAAGFVVGGAVMAATAPAWGVSGVALGYSAGTAVTAALPWALVWRRQRMAWTSLTLRLAAAIAVLGGAVVLERRVAAEEAVAADGAAALVFLALWSLAGREDLRRVLSAVRARRSR